MDIQNVSILERYPDKFQGQKQVSFICHDSSQLYACFSIIGIHLNKGKEKWIQKVWKGQGVRRGG